MGDVIETAWRAGAKFDLWDECFDYETWRSAFEKHGLDVNIAAQRGYGEGEVLPWQHLGGPQSEYLLKHYREAVEAAGED